MRLPEFPVTCEVCGGKALSREPALWIAGYGQQHIDPSVCANEIKRKANALKKREEELRKREQALVSLASESFQSFL